MDDEPATQRATGPGGGPPALGYSLRAGTLGLAGTPNQQYIEALYSLLLKRTASSAEVSGWQAGLAVAGRSGVAAAFLHSTEYRTDVVEAYYTSLLGRTTAPSLAEMDSWVTSGLDFLTIREAFELSQEFRSAA